MTFSDEVRDSYRGPTLTRHDAFSQHVENNFKLMDQRIRRVELAVERLLDILRGGPHDPHNPEE